MLSMSELFLPSNMSAKEGMKRPETPSSIRGSFRGKLKMHVSKPNVDNPHDA